MKTVVNKRHPRMHYICLHYFNVSPKKDVNDPIFQTTHRLVETFKFSNTDTLCFQCIRNNRSVFAPYPVCFYQVPQN
jgi:hypothetical protein